MAGRFRKVVFVSICSLALALSVTSALGYGGTRAGKKLAREMLSSYKHVHHLAGSVHGSVYYCPSFIGGYAEEFAFQAPRSCKKHPATASWVNTLSRGKGVSAVGKVTAKGRPTITFVARKTATFIKARGASCWTKQSEDGFFVGSPPFAFFGSEYMTVGRKHNGRIELIGTSKSFNGFKEIDTLNAKTHHMIGESIYVGRNKKRTEQHLITSYHQVPRAPKLPRTAPVC